MSISASTACTGNLASPHVKTWTVFMSIFSKVSTICIRASRALQLESGTVNRVKFRAPYGSRLPPVLRHNVEGWPFPPVHKPDSPSLVAWTGLVREHEMLLQSVLCVRECIRCVTETVHYARQEALSQSSLVVTSQGRKNLPGQFKGTVAFVPAQ